jgi:outer membrane biosynthesis protein TonB
MTIVSTASSGGGLPDYGVFSGEKIYTVYLDARTTTDDPAFAWTLQYAPLRGTSGVPNADGASRGAKGLTPPYAIFKEIPRWPTELVRRYLQRVIVVSGVINTEGKLDQMLIIQSPDDRLTEGITEALNKWAFRPAELNGQPVSVKVLLGIPLALPE